MAKTPQTKVPADQTVAPERLFEVRPAESGKSWSWHAKATANGKVTFQGESHPNESNALRAINQEMVAVGSTKPMHIAVYDKHDAKEPARMLVKEVTPTKAATSKPASTAKPAAPTAASLKKTGENQSITVNQAMDKVAKKATEAVRTPRVSGSQEIIRR